MNSKITNLDKQLLIIPLNSGQCVHLAPGEASPPIPEYEVIDNPKIAKLVKRSLIAMSEAATAVPARASRMKKGRSPKKTK